MDEITIDYLLYAICHAKYNLVSCFTYKSLFTIFLKTSFPKTLVQHLPDLPNRLRPCLYKYSLLKSKVSSAFLIGGKTIVTLNSLVRRHFCETRCDEFLENIRLP